MNRRARALPSRSGSLLLTTLLVLALLTVPVGCSGRSSESPAPADGHDHSAATDTGSSAGSGAPPLFSDLGTYHFPITTDVPRAQEYFDQGIRLCYAFNLQEGKLGFAEAARLDPKSGMAWWGVAYALGPNINVPRLPDQLKEAIVAIRKAAELTEGLTPRERDYIAALAKRYSDDPNAKPNDLDLAYATAMGEVSRRYPDDLDAATLYAESLMDLRPWQLWSLDFQPAPGTPEIVALLESVLTRNPDHPGANHFYVHAMEASGHPEKALPAAERLRAMMPGAGHLVHMPFHIYSRLGRYEDAAEANERAVEADRRYQKLPRQNLYTMMYYPHNLHSLTASLTMAGRSAAALAASHDLAEAVTPKMAQEMQMTEVFLPMNGLILARFGKWDEVLALPKPPDDLKYASGTWHFARGLALAAKGRFDEAAAEQKTLAAIAEATPPDTMESLNRAKDVPGVAGPNLAGEIALRRGRLDDAIRELTEAVRRQDRLNYDEPAPWYYPVRHSLGVALIQAKKSKDAEAVYRKDLEKWPDNGWALYGLSESLRLQNRKEEADAAQAQFRKAWEKADVTLTASRF